MSKQNIEETEIQTLDQVKPNTRVRIADLIAKNTDLYRRLVSLGLVVGTTLEVIRSAPFGDPISVRILGYNLALRLSEAKSILVVPIS